MKLRVAGAQIPVSKDIGANVETIERALRHAAAEKADVLLTPEGSLSGYTHEFDAKAVERAMEGVAASARALRIALALGTCFVEPRDGRCYNQIRFHGGDGAFLGFHSKTLNCGTLTEPSVGEINHYAVAPLRTFELNGGRSADDLSNLWRQYHEANLRARARAGGLWIVSVDNCHPLELRCSSPSGVLNPQGDWVCKAPEIGEHIFAHTIEIGG